MRYISADSLTLQVIVSPCELSTDNHFDCPTMQADIDNRLHAGDNLAWCDIAITVRGGGFIGREVLGGVTLSPVSYPVTNETTNAAMEEVWDVVREHGMLSEAHSDLQRAIATHGWEAEVMEPTWPEVRGVVWI
jgi:hypothetical protein